MNWTTEPFGVRRRVFMGFCGEVPVALLRKTGGCYDYRRRMVTELVRTGYLKERKFRGERRHVIRSLSLTSRGLNQGAITPSMTWAAGLCGGTSRRNCWSGISSSSRRPGPAFLTTAASCWGKRGSRPPTWCPTR